MAFGFATSQVLHAAVKLRVPDLLANGAESVDQLADGAGCEPRSLRRLMRALTVLGLVSETTPGRYALTGLGQPLRADHPRSMRSSVLFVGDAAAWHAWGELVHGVRTGKAAFDHVHGEPLFAHLARHPERSEIFNAAMRQGSAHLATLLPQVFDFSGAKTVVDVGGGNGTLLAAVLAAAPHVHGILLDTAGGVNGAFGDAQRDRLADRCRIEIGDFFEAVPEGDVMLMKGILHDWDDQLCTTLLRNCRRAITNGGRLLVMETLLPSKVGAPETAGAVLSDIAMLVYTGGQERTEVEYRELLLASGFDLLEVTPPLDDSNCRVLISQPV